MKSTTAYKAIFFFKNWNRSGIIALCDFLFVLILFVLAKIFDAIFMNNESLYVGTAYGYFLLLAYIFIIIAVYSISKWCIVEFMNNEKIEARIDMKHISVFFLYNFIALISIAILGITGITFFSTALISILKQTALTTFIIFFTLASYLFVQASHVFFLTEKNITLIPEKVYANISWKLIGRWLGWNCAAIGIFFIVYMLLFLILRTTTEYFIMFFIMNLIIFIAVVGAAYFLMFWNRTYLYLTLKSAQNRDKILPQALKKK